MIAVDTETSGLDFRHSSKPFFVSICDEHGDQTYFEWDVDPLTRQPAVPDADLRYIWNAVSVASPVVMHNAKFDVTALATLSPEVGRDWPWFKTHDTVLMAHLLASNKPKDLTTLATMYLGRDISGAEKALEEAVKDCRRIVQQARLRIGRMSRNKTSTFDLLVKVPKKYHTANVVDMAAAVNAGKPEFRPILADTLEEAGFSNKAALTLLRANVTDEEELLAAWRIAEEGMPDLPSATGEAWRSDYWLPRAYAKYMWESGKEDGWAPPSELANPKSAHPYWTVLGDYANIDTGVTIALYARMDAEIRRRKLGKIYECRRETTRIPYDMEEYGVTGSLDRLDELTADYTERTESASRKCVNVAASLGHTLELGKGTSKSLRDFCFDVLDLERIRGKKSKTDAPTLDKGALGHYLLTLPQKSKALFFIKNLAGKRKFDTNLSYMDQYRRFAVPTGHAGYVRLHPSINQTGTDTLRWSHSNPNEANIAKSGYECPECEGRGKGCSACDGKGVLVQSLRYCFGPAPGREWWSMDAKNIELRIPAYGSGEQTLIDLFERADEPPFYGSNHLANFSAVYPDLWSEAVAEVGINNAGPYCKKKYAATYYQWCKNGGFAIQYGAVEKADGWGTADKAFHKQYAHRLLKEKFRKLEELNQKQIRYANKYGYVETMPDRTVDPARGYPLLCTRTDYGRVLETVPLSYHVQGTAMWWTMKAMIRCAAKLREWRDRTGFDGRLVMQVHDEVVFDFPKSAVHPREVSERGLFRKLSSNLWRVRHLQALMEEGGSDLGVPTPVGVEYHEHHWGEGVTI